MYKNIPRKGKHLSSFSILSLEHSYMTAPAAKRALSDSAGKGRFKLANKGFNFSASTEERTGASSMSKGIAAEEKVVSKNGFSERLI